MPFASDKQRRYLYSQKPEVAKKFAAHKAEGGPLSAGYYSLGDWIPFVEGENEKAEETARQEKLAKRDLAVDQLETLALEGNEWAAQALAQNGYAFDPDNNEFFKPTSGWGGAIGSTVGGVGGTIGGATLGPGGAFGGGIGGGALGGATGEAIEAALSDDPRTKSNIWGEAAWGALPGGVIGKGGQIAKKGAQEAAEKLAKKEAREAAAKEAAKRRADWRKKWKNSPLNPDGDNFDQAAWQKNLDARLARQQKAAENYTHIDYDNPKKYTTWYGERRSDPTHEKSSAWKRFEEGGKVPWWKSAIKKAWKNDNLKEGKGRWSKLSKNKNKSGPLGG